MRPAMSLLRYLIPLRQWLDRLYAPAVEPTTPVEPPAELNKDKVAEYWSDQELTDNYFSPDVYWLANPEVQRRYQHLATGRRSAGPWFRDCVGRYLAGRMPVERMLSIGCGAGKLELDLAKLGAFQSCDAFDIAPGMIKEAQRSADSAGVRNIHFAVRDVEVHCPPPAHYDAVWFNGSLHHIRDLEIVLGQVARSLRRDGYLFVNEYIGPDQFNFTAREKEIMRCAFRLLPDRYRQSLARGNRGQVLAELGLPTPAEVVASDPSEAVRSTDIPRVIANHFDIVEFNPCGGTLLQFLLGNIAGHFRPDDADALELLHLLFAIEDTLMRVGEIQTHFAVLIARPR